MAKVVKIKVNASLSIEWDKEPTDGDIDVNQLWKLLDNALNSRIIRCQTTRYDGRKKTSTKFTPILELKEIING